MKIKIWLIDKWKKCFWFDLLRNQIVYIFTIQLFQYDISIFFSNIRIAGKRIIGTIDLIETNTSNTETDYDQ